MIRRGNARITSLAALLAVCSVPAVAAAHPGHGPAGASAAAHHMATPEHAWPVVLAIAAGLVAGWLFDRRERAARRRAVGER